VQVGSSWSGSGFAKALKTKPVKDRIVIDFIVSDVKFNKECIG
jgi:hypothetical protein